MVKQQKVVLQQIGPVSPTYKVVRLVGRVEPRIGEYLKRADVEMLIAEPKVTVEIR